jgi:hypothetical protein
VAVSEQAHVSQNLFVRIDVHVVTFNGLTQGPVLGSKI